MKDIYWVIHLIKLGKVEGEKEDNSKKNWHGHVTAVTVAPYFRKQGLARAFMNFLEKVSEDVHDAYYVDLFVRSSNAVAIGMYHKLGYYLYQTVDQYDDILMLVIILKMGTNLLKMLMI